jgi:8-amino-7-oxononanoate synthase
LQLKMKKIDRRLQHRSDIDSSNISGALNSRSDVNVTLLNITSHGARLRCTDKINVSTHIEILLKHLPSDSYVTVDAKVIWRKRHSLSNGSKSNGHIDSWDYGVLFFQAPKDILRKIETFVNGESPADDRRQRDRRLSSFAPHSNARQYERRGSKDFLIKINRLATSFDKWTTYHTYLRPIGEMKYPHAILHGKKKIMMGSNSYLGLSGHPLVKEAAIKAIEKFGVGSGGVPVLSGTTILHEELCERIARFKGTESAILYPSGYGANLACLSTLFGNESDVILNDERNHASIIDGCRMSNAKVRFFKHNDLRDLETKLLQYSLEETKLIVVDGVYSMDGDLCELPGIYSLAQKYNAMVMVDDAHATGVIGEGGRGTANHFGLTGKIDLITVTLSKSIGCAGGAIAGSKALIKYLVHLSRAYIFSTSLPPPVCAGAIAALKIMEENPEIVTKLRNNVRYLSEGLKRLGFKVQDTESAIIPIIIGDELLTYKLTYQLEDAGVFVNAVSRPAVPRDLSRLRVSPNAQHNKDDIDATLNAFEKVGRRLGIINN